MTLTDTAPRTTPDAAPGTALGSAPEGSAVRTRGLTKAYGGRTVVDGLDLDLPSGVVSGFVGPNGAGKTTTIRMLLGLVRPTSGDGVVLGEPLARPARYLGRVGALIEGPAFTPSLSGRDNLLVLARAGRLPAVRVDAALGRVGLSGRGDDRFASYSLGMKQRLGIAAALLPLPKLLVLDEPTNGLDPAGIAQMRELIASFRDEGMTVLVSSHLLSELEQISDHLVMIRAGRLVHSGSVSGLLAMQQPQIRLRTERPEDGDLVADVAAALGWAATTGPDGDVRVELPVGTDDGEGFARAAELNRRAHAVGTVLTRLDVHRPSLEDAYFSLTGTGSGDVR